MVQGIRNDEQEIHLRNIIDSVTIPTGNEVRKFVIDLYGGSRGLGIALYESGFIGALDVIKRNYFINHYEAIFTYMEKVGTAESYIGLFKALFGDTTVVTFDFGSPAGTLVATVQAPLELDNWITIDTLEQITTIDTAEKIAFSNMYDDISFAQVVALLKLLVPYGIFATFTIIPL